MTVFDDDYFTNTCRLTENFCNCGGQILEIGDFEFLIGGHDCDIITISVCLDCEEVYEEKHRKH